MTGFVLDRVSIKLQHPIARLRRRQNLPELHARVDVGELLAVDRFDDLPLFQLPGLIGRRTFLDVLEIRIVKAG